MQHVLYTGVSQSGKTTLARAMSRALFSKGQTVYVFDPLGTRTKGGGWQAHKIFTSEDEFLSFVHDSKNNLHAHFFFDEAHRIFGHQMRENFWMLTEGRHEGMCNHLITQRPNKLHPDVRDQCGTCYMFRLSLDDVKGIGGDYGHSDLHKISLDKGDFLILNSGSATFSRANVFKLVPD